MWPRAHYASRIASSFDRALMSRSLLGSRPIIVGGIPESPQPTCEARKNFAFSEFAAQFGAIVIPRRVDMPPIDGKL